MDIVITYVNGLDPLWQQDYQQHTNIPILEKRFRDWGTLQYLFRGIEINMPFIEYMAYKLKELDQDGLEYIDIFDEEVFKLGITVDEIVSRQHFDVITREVSMSNSRISLKNINNIDFAKEFENISEIDMILSKEKCR